MKSLRSFFNEQPSRSQEKFNKNQISSPLSINKILIAIEILYLLILRYFALPCVLSRRNFMIEKGLVEAET